MVAPFQPDPQKIAAIRAELPATGAGIYLNTGTAGPLPLPAQRAMRELEEHELRVGRADLEGWEEFRVRLEETRGVLAALLGADPSQMALTHSTTDGLNTAVWAPPWRDGDRIVTTDEEHPGLLAPLLAVRERHVAELIRVPVGGTQDEARLLEAFQDAIRPGTRLVAVSHVTWMSGVRLPVDEIGRLAHAAGAWFVVDGAQSAGILPLEVQALEADFYAFAGQKWLLGPEGTGGLWVGPRAAREGRQTTAGYLSYEHLAADGQGERWPDARRYEATTFHRPSTVGLARSVGWLEMQVGLAWAQERAARLARAIVDRLAGIDGVQVITPPERMAGLITFRVGGWPAEQLRAELSRRAFAITRTVDALDALRISVGWFNTEEELEAFAAAVGELAAYTPESLPHRPGLVIIPPGA